MVRIGIDAFGGDNGIDPVVIASTDAVNHNSDIYISIIGDTDLIKSSFSKLNLSFNDRIDIVDAKEKIEMNDHPVFALRSKTNSSIVVAGNLLINNKIDCFISAGNTGALVALALFYLKPIKGIERPAVAAIVPTKNNPMLLIDSGCNVDSKPEWLYKYAIIGNTYIKEMLGIEKPRIGLLSVGVEENKGNNLTLSTYKLLKENTNLNFIGNVEARDLPFGICDILITDGFDGNVFLKTYEGTAKMLFSVLKENLLKSLITKLSALIIKPALKDVLKKFDAKIYGGAPILGANSLILKCHGNTTDIELSYAIKQAYNLINKDIILKIKNCIGA